uniref:Arginine repressor n=1 Tax=Lygus hesperus TaxID=30085 RepID=A0A0A9W989_LYGHE
MYDDTQARATSHPVYTGVIGSDKTDDGDRYAFSSFAKPTSTPIAVTGDRPNKSVASSDSQAHGHHASPFLVKMDNETTFTSFFDREEMTGGVSDDDNSKAKWY